MSVLIWVGVMFDRAPGRINCIDPFCLSSANTIAVLISPEIK